MAIDLILLSGHGRALQRAIYIEDVKLPASICYARRSYGATSPWRGRVSFRRSAESVRLTVYTLLAATLGVPADQGLVTLARLHWIVRCRQRSSVLAALTSLRVREFQISLPNSMSGSMCWPTRSGPRLKIELADLLGQARSVREIARAHDGSGDFRVECAALVEQGAAQS